MSRSEQLSRIMALAWTLAREGAGKFGGKSKMYFACALKMAWSRLTPPAIWQETRPRAVYRKGLGSQFLLPGTPAPRRTGRSGQFMLPGFCQ